MRGHGHGVATAFSTSCLPAVNAGFVDVVVVL
jgi:hypothetical protein